MRTDFTSTTLVRLLGPWAEGDAAAPSADVSERLGLWVNAFDAIGLQSANQSIRAMAAAANGPAPRSRTADALRSDVQRARAALAQAIAQPVRPAADGKPGYARWQLRHQELQRMMEQMIRPLRDHVRQAVAPASPRLRQLAALDAVLEHLVAPREQALLPRVATLLERCWRQHADAEDRFEAEWRQAMLAEIDLRLEPVHGLVDALANE